MYFVNTYFAREDDDLFEEKRFAFFDENCCYPLTYRFLLRILLAKIQ
jgi:hypothetical protein